MCASSQPHLFHGRSQSSPPESEPLGKLDDPLFDLDAQVVQRSSLLDGLRRKREDVRGRQRLRERQRRRQRQMAEQMRRQVAASSMA